MTTYTAPSFIPFAGTEAALSHLSASKFEVNTWAASSVDYEFYQEQDFSQESILNLVCNVSAAEEETSLIRLCVLADSWEEEAAHALMAVARLSLWAPESWLMIIAMADDVARHILEGRAEQAMEMAWASLRLMHKRSAGVQRSWKLTLDCVTAGFPQLKVPKKEDQD